MNLKRSIQMLFLAGSLPLAACLSTSADVPAPLDTRLNDFANIVADSRKDQLKEILSQVEHQTGVEITIVTVPSVAEYVQKSSMIDSVAKTIFNKWGVGNKVVNNGILILVSVKDRMVRFEFGSNYNPRVLVHLNDVLKEKILPFFTRGNYSDGTFASAMYAIQEVTTPVGFVEYYSSAFILGFLSLASLGLCLYSYSREKSVVVLGSFLMTGFFVFFLFKDLKRSSQSHGFGGGGTSGVGLTARWPRT